MHPLQTLQDMNRRIYASLPWGYRVAQLLTKLSFNLTDTLGRTFYALFLDQGVSDMPPGAVAGTRPERLPKGYGQDFGKRVYSILLRNARQVSYAETAASNLLMAAAQGRFDLSGMTLRHAENLVLRSAANAAIDVLKSERRALPAYDIQDDSNDQAKLDPLKDPSAFRELDELLPRRELGRLLQDLKKIDPRAPSWLQAQLEGLKNVELAEQWEVTKSQVTNWEQRNLPRIQQLVRQYMNADV